MASNDNIEEKEYGLEKLAEDVGPASEFFHEYSDILDNFAGICFKKKVFDKLSSAALRVYKKRLLYLMKRIIADPDIMQSKTVVRTLRAGNNRMYYKAKITYSERVFYYVIDEGHGKIICISDSWSDHDTQSKIIDRYRSDGLPIGDIYYDMKSFLDIYKDFIGDNRKFSEVFTNETRFVHNDVQEMAVNHDDTIHNICIIGNAGSGKSLVGSNWLRKCAADENAKCLYLTMSKDLIRSRKSILRAEGIDVDHGNITFETIFGFIKEYLKDIKPKQKMKDPGESYEFFLESLKKAPKYNDISDDFRNYLWRNIHGLIEGYVAKLPEFNEECVVLPPLTKEEFCSAEYDIYKDVDIDKQLSNCFYSKYDKHGFRSRKSLYQLYKDDLEADGLWDDNDMARAILRLGYKDIGYTHIFIDECQDLTDVQMLALLYLFKNCEKRMIACDVCQVLQPTYFNLHNPLKYAELLSEDNHHVPNKKLHFNFNYRSTEYLSRFCSKIIGEMHKEMTLNIEYLNEAVSNIRGRIRPMWISSSGSEKEFYEMLKGLPPEVIQIITADKNKDNISNLITEQSVETAAECKGMEYDNVVIANIFGDVDEERFADNLWRWRCFYVAATRARELLVIIEPDSESPAGKFLRRMVHEGIIEHYNVDHHEYIAKGLSNLGPEFRENLANMQLKNGRYKDALRNFQMLKEVFPDKFDFEIEKCRIYGYMEEKEYQKAFDAIYSSAYENDRFGYLNELIKYYDLPVEVFFAASFMLELPEDQHKMIEQLRAKVHYSCNVPSVTSEEAADITRKLCEKYPVIDSKVGRYIETNIELVSKANSKLTDVLSKIR